MKVAVTGSSGFVGSALVERLVADGHEAIRMVRGSGAIDAVSALDVADGSARAAVVRWDPSRAVLDSLAGIDAVVHLAGAGVAGRRWSEKRKSIVRESRVVGTRVLAEAIAALGADAPRTLVSGSAIGYYGDGGEELVTESAKRGDGFLAEVCEAWEAATEPAERAGVRVVKLRTGNVFGHGGLLKKLAVPFRLGLGGKLGSGGQWMSWISLDDEVGAIMHAIARDDVAGPMNATSPNPVTNAELTKALAAALHRFAVVRVPRFGLELALGKDMARELMFFSQRVSPGVLQQTGYSFHHADLESALHAIYG